MLSQIAGTYGLGENFVGETLAHENAHANVAEQTGHVWVGYAVIFVKDEKGNLISLQPLHFTKPDPSWGPKEALERNIEMTLAPEKYRDELSEGDRLGIKRDEALLKEALEREEHDAERLRVLREKLGSG